jgi:chromosome segregation ATPase
MSTAVAQAEAALARARAEDAKQKREDAMVEIKRLSREGAELLKQLRPLTAQIKQAQQERLNLHGQLLQAQQQIAVYSAPPDPLTFPSDAEIEAHAAQLVLWQDRQKSLLRQHAAAVQRESVRPHAVTLNNRLEHVEYEIRNLSAVAEGHKPGEIQGGLFIGVESFL